MLSYKYSMQEESPFKKTLRLTGFIAPPVLGAALMTGASLYASIAMGFGDPLAEQGPLLAALLSFSQGALLPELFTLRDKGFNLRDIFIKDPQSREGITQNNGRTNGFIATVGTAIVGFCSADPVLAAGASAVGLAVAGINELVENLHGAKGATIEKVKDIGRRVRNDLYIGLAGGVIAKMLSPEGNSLEETGTAALIGGLTALAARVIREVKNKIEQVGVQVDAAVGQQSSYLTRPEAKKINDNLVEINERPLHGKEKRIKIGKIAASLDGKRKFKREINIVNNPNPFAEENLDTAYAALTASIRHKKFVKRVQKSPLYEENKTENKFLNKVLFGLGSLTGNALIALSKMSYRERIKFLAKYEAKRRAGIIS